MKNFDCFIKDLTKLIAVDSSQGESAPNQPFGKGPAKAMEVFSEIALSLGFKPVNHENYMLEISVGNGEEVGVIGHLDVVPAGTGWHTDPFTLTEKNGVYYGRGVEDDKGPTLACLYALKDVVDSGVKFNRTIKFYAGCNEESGWKDVEYFQEKKGFPKYGFSPDGSFPATYAEKGMYQVDFYIPTLKNFTDFTGGTVINAVCGSCSIKPNIQPTGYEQFGLTYDGTRLYSIGESAHGSMPWLGKNALLPMFQYLLACGEDVQNIIDCFFNDAWGVFKMANEQGNVTFSPDLICQEDGYVKLSCDVRIPAPFTIDDVCNKLCLFGYDFKVKENHPPMCTDKNGWFVNALVDSYNKVTGQNDSAYSMGGSTFARAFEYGCSIGGSFPAQPGTAHQPNENVSRENLEKMYQIYKQIFINLVK